VEKDSNDAMIFYDWILITQRLKSVLKTENMLTLANVYNVESHHLSESLKCDPKYSYNLD
jgi:hypothetical protein